MRVLEENELCAVAGGAGVCTPLDVSGNTFGGVANTRASGSDFINLYEGAVAAFSHIIERVAGAF